jgi:hypothetical protein
MKPTQRESDEGAEFDSIGAANRAWLSEVRAIAAIARTWFADAVNGPAHEPKGRPVFDVPSEDGLFLFAQAVITIREKIRREKDTKTPNLRKAMKHLQQADRILHEIEAEEVNPRSLSVLAEHRKRLEIVSAYCVPPIHEEPAKALARAAQHAWGQRPQQWDHRKKDWSDPRVPTGTKPEGPLSHVVSSAMAYLKIGISPASVCEVLRGRRRSGERKRGTK